MMDTFLSGGIVMWPLLAVAIGILAMATHATVGLHRDTPALPAVRRKLDAILFWGGMAIVMGGLGTVVGIVGMARFIQAAGDVSAPLLWGGVAVALVSLVFGLLIFLLAGILWLLLDAWAHRVARTGEFRPD
jgi:biopolymer transport protein ExbB/TolQ